MDMETNATIKSIRLEAYQMSTMKKRIPMFLLALAMMVAMAVPAFADGISTRASTDSFVTYCAYGGTNEMSTVGPSSMQDGAEVKLQQLPLQSRINSSL